MSVKYAAALLALSTALLFSLWPRQEQVIPEPMCVQAEPTQVPENLDFNGCYAYGLLSEYDRHLYSNIYKALAEFTDSARIQGANTEHVREIYDHVMADHPELFFVTGISVSEYEHGAYMTVRGQYSMTDEEIRRAEVRVEKIVSTLLKSIPANSSVYDRIKKSYEFIVGNTAYVPGAPFNQSMYSVFVGRESVCLGYAKAFQYLMQKQNIPCILVTGSIASSGIRHAWCIVQIGNDYYHVDPTWGDMYGSTTVSYDTLLVSDDTISSTHIPDSSVSYPACRSMTYDFYVLSGTYVDSTDTATVTEHLSDLSAGSEVTFKFASKQLMEFYTDYLIENKAVSKFVAGDVEYLINNTARTITIRMRGET